MDLQTLRRVRWARATASLAALLLLFSIAYIAANAPWGQGERQAFLGEASPPVQAVGAEALTQYAAEREALRAEHQRQLQGIIDDQGASAEMREAARRQLMDMIAWAEQELAIETVLRARGYERVAATVHADSVNVMVVADALTQAQSAVILELVTRETGQVGGNIKIIPIN